MHSIVVSTSLKASIKTGEPRTQSFQGGVKGVCARACVEVRGQLSELMLSFHHAGPRDETPIYQALAPLSHLTFSGYSSLFVCLFLRQDPK